MHFEYKRLYFQCSLQYDIDRDRVEMTHLAKNKMHCTNIYQFQSKNRSVRLNYHVFNVRPSWIRIQKSKSD